MSVWVESSLTIAAKTDCCSGFFMGSHADKEKVTMSKIITAQEAAQLIEDGVTIGAKDWLAGPKKLPSLLKRDSWIPAIPRMLR
jgi:hypothetical protein